MNKIDNLINAHCPNGVEFRKLWEITAWDKRFKAVENSKQSKVIKYAQATAKTIKEMDVTNGDVYILTAGKFYEGWTTEEIVGKYLCEGEVVTIAKGGTANVRYYNGKFVTANNHIATSLDTNTLDNKYLYYCLVNNTDLIQSFYMGSGLKFLSIGGVLEIEIPVPPLELQQEIVKALDIFTDSETGLVAELEAEIEARRQQYAHYRKQLLDFDRQPDIILEENISERYDLNQLSLPFADAC